jgi:hypothetical protein
MLVEDNLSCPGSSFRGDPVKAVKFAGLSQPVGEIFHHYRRTCCQMITP